MKKSLLIIIMLGMIAILVACGGASDDTDQQAEGDSNEQEGQALTITATDFEFDQEEYTVLAGEPVTIDFASEQGTHGIGIDEFEVNIKGDGSATFTPEASGEYEIYCTVPCGTGHSDMKSTLVVQ
ncbi:cytochrome C oxidase subunit II [Aquibacillus halophilus]|uniref:Cytochrome C oxidase subunit II n=1 Tax=Aquibacillus halophilus TaxID=930132 RepID=A0A6A8DD75_9BACI|nr:cupredoxin domain-containing protein [Aquibacillus halophilus]MRH43645.1 cytochrome C oxidase subunit II [Aquibacillus halophilus]